jgi:parallel beta-helix repeat protein
MPYHAFISYAHRDEEGEAAITALRSQLELSLGAYLGQTASIFQDKAGLLVGQLWEEKIESALNCPCLIPIVTPAYLKSHHCLDELVRFLEVEGRKQQADRILPLYYIEVGAIEQRLGRPGRLVEDLTSKQDRAIDILLQRQMADIRWFRTRPPEEVMRTTEARVVMDKVAVEVAVRAANVRRVPTLTVTPDGSGLRSISAAIRLAEPGARIIVKGPATYRESLIIDKPLELIGESLGEHVRLVGADGAAITCTGAPVRIASLHLTSERFNGAIISGGYCVMEEVEVDGSRHSGILIRDGAEAVLVQCRLQHADDCGVHVQHRGTKCTIVSSTIRENGRGGLFYSQEAEGVAEGNLIERNGWHGIYIAAGANPRIRRNRIRDHEDAGVLA